MVKKIGLLLAARSDFGIQKQLIDSLTSDKRFELNIYVNSAIISTKFGNNIKEIKKIKAKKFYLNFKYSNSNQENIIYYFANILLELRLLLKKNTLDGFIITGDRFEMLAAAIVCLNYNLPIVHFCGGSITEGSLDDIYRYSISKMSSLHLVETQKHKNHLLKTGIRNNVYVVGSPALENLEKIKLNSEVINNLKIKSLNKRLIIACFHPETNISKQDNIKNLTVLLKFLRKVDANVVITYPNADVGFNDYIFIINKFLLLNKNCKIIKDLGSLNYYSLLQKADLLIGNSSSGIIESCSFKLPVLNLGNRQKGRFAPKNVTHVPFNYSKIIKNYNKIFNRHFLNKIKKIKNPYFKRNVSKKSIDLIYNILFKN
jgi:GDP/UDP-N,N'-diacetylbacillosamine 2-epimerase (hydrolysing)